MRTGIIICSNSPKWEPFFVQISKGCFHREGDGELRYFRPIDGDIPTLENTTELDAIICLGSAKSAYDDDQWMLELCEFFRSIANTKLKLFGSCFGHQLINKAFGGTVTKNVDQGFIFGADGIKISIPEDLGDSAISMLLEDGTSLKMLQSHGDEVVTLGEGARLLGSSERCLNEVVLVRGNILTMQCHPDLTPELMMTNIWPAISGRGAVDPADKDKVEAEMAHLDTYKCLDIIRAFMNGQKISRGSI